MSPPNAFRLYWAGVVGTFLTFLCHLFNHWPYPCWWTRTRLYRWAEGITGFDEAHPLVCGVLLSSSLTCNQPPGHDGPHSHSQPGFTFIDLSGRTR